RGDAGQLGLAPPDSCRTAREAFPCSRTPKRVPLGRPQSLVVAGDLFTCAMAAPAARATPAASGAVATGDVTALSCWGASRDGFFGAAADCPGRLRDAWPTRAGPVVAPRAACASAPIAVAGFE